MQLRLLHLKEVAVAAAVDNIPAEIEVSADPVVEEQVVVVEEKGLAVAEERGLAVAGLAAG